MNKSRAFTWCFAVLLIRELLEYWNLSLKFLKLNEGFQLFHDGGPYHIDTNPLVCSANQWTGFYMIDLRYELMKTIVFLQ